MVRTTTRPTDTADGLPGLALLLDALHDPGADDRTIDLVGFASSAPLGVPLALQRDRGLLGRLARALERAAGDAGLGVFRLDDRMLVLLSDADAARAVPAFTVGAAIGAVAPDLAAQVVHVRHHAPAGTDDATELLRHVVEALEQRSERTPRAPAGQARDALLSVLAECGLARDPDARARIAADAVATGRALGLDDGDLHDVLRAAELQDIGMLAVPQHVLAKPGALTPEEWALVRRHPLVGERIVGAAPALRGVAQLVRSCSERFDGTGYPDGLAGRDIPLGARVVAVCVAFEAMVRGRAWRRARTVPEALAELQVCAGHQFDPRVVDAFVRSCAASSALPRVAAA